MPEGLIIQFYRINNNKIVTMKTEKDNYLTPWKVTEGDSSQMQRQFQKMHNKLTFASQLKKIKSNNQINPQKLSSTKESFSKHQKSLNQSKQKEGLSKNMKKLKTFNSCTKLQTSEFQSQELKYYTKEASSQNFKKINFGNRIRLKSHYFGQKQSKSLKKQNQIVEYPKININIVREKIKLQKIEQILMKKLKKFKIKIEEENQYNPLVKKYSVKNIQWTQKKQLMLERRKSMAKKIYNEGQKNKLHVLDRLLSNY